MPRVIVACTLAAALSLLLPSEPSYDPMAWLVWGRELSSLELDTAGGPSWKPLPVVLTTAFAPFAQVDPGLPPALWVVVARAGALLALALAFRLAARLAGGGTSGAVAGAVAAAALLLMPDWFQFTAHGSEAPLAVALMLWAVERHLDGRPGGAVALALACGLRPELVPFLALYGLWAWHGSPRLRPWLAAVALLLPLAWIAPDWIGSGNPLDGGAQARSEPVWSLSHAERPWLRALERVHNHAGIAVELLALVAVATALARRRLALVVLGAAALAEIALFVAMTQAGFSGNPRYALPGLALAAVLAGVGAGVVLQVPGRRPLALAGAAAALAALGGGAVANGVAHVAAEAREVGDRMQVHRDLARAVGRVGGPGAVAAVGSATSNRALHTRLAWELGTTIDAVERVREHRVVFRSLRELLVGRVYLSGHARRRVTLARVNGLWVYRRDAPFTRPLQGFHTSRADGRNARIRVVTR